LDLRQCWQRALTTLVKVPVVTAAAQRETFALQVLSANLFAIQS
jgi:hypothetical protein